jgi:hypothetical protein
MGEEREGAGRKMGLGGGGKDALEGRRGNVGWRGGKSTSWENKVSDGRGKKDRG